MPYFFEIIEKWVLLKLFSGAPLVNPDRNELLGLANMIKFPIKEGLITNCYKSLQMSKIQSFINVSLYVGVEQTTIASKYDYQESSGVERLDLWLLVYIIVGAFIMAFMCMKFNFFIKKLIWK